MAWRFRQSVAPTSEPVTRAEAKLHLRVDHSEEDALIDDLITSARMTAERMLRRQIMAATWVAHGDAFPTCGEPVYLQWPPVQSVTSIVYQDTNGDAQTWAAANYSVDIYATRASIRPAYNISYPSTYADINVIEITYVAGYSSATNVPKPIKQAILLMIGHWYENREEVVGAAMKDVPMAAKYLIGNWAVPEFT